MNFDNDMSRAKRAGDMRRVLTAVLHYTEKSHPSDRGSDTLKIDPEDDAE